MICLLSILSLFQMVDPGFLPLETTILPSPAPLVGSPWAFTVEVVNPNDTDLEIVALEKPCSCVELSYPREIPAGETVSINGTWIMAQPGKQTLSLDLYGLLNREPYHDQLEVVAVSTGPVQFSSANLDFGRVKAGTIVKRTTELTLAEGFRIVKVTNPNPEILTINRRNHTLEITIRHDKHQKLGFETRVPITVASEKRQVSYLLVSADLIP